MLLSMMDIDECSCMITKEEEVVVAEDLIIEILLLLPPVSVIRFKRVCKSWYSLISNPDLLFLKHYHHHPQRLLEHHPDDIFLISTVEGKQRQHNPPPPPPAAEYVLQTQTQNQNQNQEQLKVFLDHALSVFIPQKFSSSSPKLIDSCNGLLLYRIGNNHHPISGDCDETTQYQVFNPMTKQCFELPLLLVDHFGNNFKKGDILWLHIVFDPSVSLSFKVVICFVPVDSMGDSGIYVYSSATTSWKYLTKFVPLDNNFYCRFRVVLLDGFLYLYKCSLELLCFDIVKDKIWPLQLPRRGWETNMLYFGKCGGRLQLIRRNHDDRSYYGHLTWPFSFYIMELELEVDHDQPKIRNWTVKHEHDVYLIRRNDYEAHFPLTAQIIHIYKTGAGKKNGEDEDDALLFLNVERNTVISYNLTSKTYGKEEQKKISDVDHYLGLHAFPYSPTLLPFSC